MYVRTVQYCSTVRSANSGVDSSTPGAEAMLAGDGETQWWVGEMSGMQ